MKKTTLGYISTIIAFAIFIFLDALVLKFSLNFITDWFNLGVAITYGQAIIIRIISFIGHTIVTSCAAMADK